MSDNLIYIMSVKDGDDWDEVGMHWEPNIFSSFLYNCLSTPKKNKFFLLRNCSVAHPMVFFRICFYRIEILHLYSRFSASEIRDICKFLFKMFTHVRSIGFDCIEADFGEIGFRTQRYDVSEDFVIDLCDSAERYTSMLGKQLQTDLKRFKKKLCSEFKDVRYECLQGQEIAVPVFQQIMGFSASRMAVKAVASSHSVEKSRRLLALVQNFGFLFVIYIDGEVRAGVICTLYGKDMFMHVIAHDPVFDRFRLGKLACYFSICTAIGKGAVRYHLLSGWYDYKVRFLGKHVRFDRLEVYRSLGSMFCCFRNYIKILYRGNGRRFKNYLRARACDRPGAPADGLAARIFLGRILMLPVRWLRKGGRAFTRH